MLAVTLTGVMFAVAVCAASLGLMGWLLSGAPGPVTRSIRASARGETAGGASGSDRPAPRPAATQERPGP